MDDPYGCLRGVEQFPENVLWKWKESQDEKKVSFETVSRKIYRCSSCEEQLVYVANEFCRECPKCKRVFECNDQFFQEENPGRSTASPTPPAHLKNVIRKWRIDKTFSFNQISFLGNVIA